MKNGNDQTIFKNIGLEGAIAILALLGISLFLVFHFGPFHLQAYAPYPLYIVLAIGGSIQVAQLINKAIHYEFGSDLIAGLSIITSIFLGEYLAGALVVLMLSGGESIEKFALNTASKMLEALAKRTPTIAHRKAGDQTEHIEVDQIRIGDYLSVFPHEICPVDGKVVEGNGVMDESYLTGEPFMIDKAPGSEVLSGAVNGDNGLVIQATKLAGDSRFAKIMQVINESEQKRPHMRRLADQLGAWYTPIALVIAALAWLFSGEPVRFLAVLVIATPCPLLIAIPIAIIGSISLLAKRGILIKNPLVLEQIDQCQTMIFDKTGTLSYGIPELTQQTVFNDFEANKVLQQVASLEKYSKHPLSRAILNKATQENLTLFDAKEISEPKGMGLQGVIQGHKVIVTSRRHLSENHLMDQITSLPQTKGLECIVTIDGELAAHYTFRDAPRSDSKPFVQHLAKKHGITKTLIISGDREEEVRYLAEHVGIDNVYANRSPEEKVAIVENETKMAKTAYLGDGINDAPALIVSSVGIAFGRNSDITAEAAGAVVMDNSLEKVDEFLHISSRMKKIAMQSAIGGMAFSILGMLIAAFGYLPPVAGAISQEIIDVIAILNSLRTIWRPSILSDMR